MELGTVATDTTTANKDSLRVRATVIRRQLPAETRDFEQFKEQGVDLPITMTAEGWRCALRETEVSDNKQKIKARPYLAWGVGALLVVQNIGVWFIVVWALQKDVLDDLQLIFGALVAGSLTQSYFLLRLITEKVFGDINYHNGHEKIDG